MYPAQTALRDNAHAHKRLRMLSLTILEDMADCSSTVMLFFVGVIILIGKLGRAGTIDGKQNERDVDVCGTGDADKTMCSGVYSYTAQHCC